MKPATSPTSIFSARPVARNRHALVISGYSLSGASAIAASLRDQGVDFGNHLRMDRISDALEGGLEDMDIVDIGRRLRRHLLPPRGIGLADESVWNCPVIRQLEDEAVALLGSRFANCPRWGLHNDGVLRFLPFWQRVLSRLDSEVSWILALRHPLEAVQARRRNRSLSPFRKEPRNLSLDLYEWLAWVVPHLSRLRETKQTFLAVSHDRLTRAPGYETRRITQLLDLPVGKTGTRTFTTTPSVSRYLDGSHGAGDDTTEATIVLAERAWECLDLLACDGTSFEDPEFWQQWSPIERQVRDLAPLLRHIDSLQVARNQAEINPFSPILKACRGVQRSVALWSVKKSP